MDYPNGLPDIKWTSPENNIPNEFLAASASKLHVTSAFVNPVQPLATILNNCTSNIQLLNTKYMIVHVVQKV